MRVCGGTAAAGSAPWKTAVRTGWEALLETVVEGCRAGGCEWLHVDFEEHLKSFYVDTCGFRETAAGLIALA